MEPTLSQALHLLNGNTVNAKIGQGGVIKKLLETTKFPEERIAEFQAVFASADAAAGEGEFRPCAACHSLAAGDNKTGPYLAGVVGRPVDTASGYDYSGALEQVVDVWTPEHLNFFLEDPQGYTPGTKMNFRGIDNVQDRANLIAYLQTISG